MKPLTRKHERREECQHLSVLLEASLGWWEDARFVTTPAQIADISQSGCMVESPSYPARRKELSVWFRPVAIAKSDWSEGIVVAVEKPWFRSQRVRIRFLELFPFDVFKSLVHGPDYRHVQSRSQRPEYEQDTFWR